MGLHPNLDLFFMTQDEIIEMARQAKILQPETVLTHLEAFAKLVAQHEREACAKVCEDQADDGTEGEWDGCCLSLAKKIRARGQE